MSEAAGKYLVIEGTDGAGKSTQVRGLRVRLADEGVWAHGVAEPGGTELGGRIRQLLLDPRIDKLPGTEFDLFNAGRREVVHQIIEPKITAGETIVADRNWFSSVAYQGYGRGLSVDTIIETSKRTMGDYFMPDGIVIIDVPIEVAKARKYMSGDTADWFEQQGLPFFEKVREGYGWLAEKFNVDVIDGDMSVEQVEADIFAKLGAVALT